MKIRLIALVMVLLSGVFYSRGLHAQSEKAGIKPERYQHNKEIEEAFGYSQAVKAGNTIYISGYTSGGDMATQVKNVYEGLQKVLESYGIGFENVVKENLYTTDIREFNKHVELRKKSYNGLFPAATWVEVKALLDPAAKLEVELIAVVP